jgi:UDP-2,3-diacylglucosamine hydrolase
VYYDKIRRAFQSFKPYRVFRVKSHTLFISDLHLQESEPAITEAFVDFMQTEAPNADALYILGDFFEVWVGDDDLAPFHQKIIAELKCLAERGVPVFFMRGNRDFLIGKRFAKATGVTLLADPTVITLYGKPVLLMHGDSLCILDHAHQRFRRYTGYSLVQRIFLSLPLAWRQSVGQKLRGKSQRRGQTTDQGIMDVYPPEVIKQMEQHRVTTLIHGHTHRPYTHDIEELSQEAVRIVLGAWHERSSILRYDSEGVFSLNSSDYSSESH